MKTKLTCLILLLAALAALTAIRAQDESAEECAAEKLAAQQSVLADYLTPDFEADYDMALANLFRLGALYQSMALQCGYSPNDQQVDVMLLQALDFVSLDDLLAAQSVGKDVEQILLELERAQRRSADWPNAVQRPGTDLGRGRSGLRGLPRKRCHRPLDRRYLDQNQRYSFEIAGIFGLQPSPLFGGKHRTAHGLCGARIRGRYAGFLWYTTHDTTACRSGSIFG